MPQVNPDQIGMVHFWRLVLAQETLLPGDEYLDEHRAWKLMPAEFCTGEFLRPPSGIVRREISAPIDHVASTVSKNPYQIETTAPVNP